MSFAQITCVNLKNLTREQVAERSCWLAICMTELVYRYSLSIALADHGTALACSMKRATQQNMLRWPTN